MVSKAAMLVVATLLFSVNTVFAIPIKVAVEYSPTSPMSQEGSIKVVNQLNDDTYFDFQAVSVTGTDIDTADELKAFDVVIIGDGGDGGNDDLAVFSSALKTWVENGGGLVGAGWIVWENGVTTGTPNYEIDSILPVNAISYYNYFWNSVQSITDNTHPVTSGVNDFFVSGCCIEFPSYPQVDDWGRVLGAAYGNPSIVVGEIGKGRSVYLGPAYTGGSGYSNSIQSGDADKLLEQAVAWAAGPLYIPVTIDIKPGSYPNSININDAGVIPVAILGTPALDVHAINPETIKLDAMVVKAVGKANNLLAHFEDIDADGDDDLVVQIQDQDNAFAAGATSATLTGNLVDGTPILGEDEITLVP